MKMNQEANGEGFVDSSINVDEPIDFVRFALGEHVTVKMRCDRQFSGIMEGFDHHLNMVLSGAVETVTSSEVDAISSEEIINTTTREIPLIYIRGDAVVLISTPNRRSN